uniref:Uncharacterized protein n=1 Tax=Panagrolaimus sp. ES5 TaxID=591445 RepID=A0AC34F5D7_9BILA
MTIYCHEDPSYNPDLTSYRRILRLVKPELIPSLKHYGAHNYSWTENNHLQFITEKNGGNKFECTEETLNKYFCAKKRNLRQYKGADEKLNYLQRNFLEWYDFKYIIHPLTWLYG